MEKSISTALSLGLVAAISLALPQAAWAEDARPAAAPRKFKIIGKVDDSESVDPTMQRAIDDAVKQKVNEAVKQEVAKVAPAPPREYRYLLIGSGLSVDEGWGQTGEGGKYQSDRKIAPYGVFRGYSLSLDNNLMTQFQGGLQVTEHQKNPGYRANFEADVKFTRASGKVRPIGGFGAYGEAEGRFTGPGRDRVQFARAGLRIDPIGVVYASGQKDGGTTIVLTTTGTLGWRMDGPTQSGEFSGGLRLAAAWGKILEAQLSAEYVGQLYIGDLGGLKDEYKQAFNNYENETQRQINECTKSEEIKEARATAGDVADAATDAAAAAATVAGGGTPTAPEVPSSPGSIKDDVAAAVDICKEASRRAKILAKETKSKVKRLTQMDKALKMAGGLRAAGSITVFPVDLGYLRPYFQVVGSVERSSQRIIKDNLDISTTPQNDVRVMINAGAATH